MFVSLQSAFVRLQHTFVCLQYMFIHSQRTFAVYKNHGNICMAFVVLPAYAHCNSILLNIFILWLIETDKTGQDRLLTG